MKLIKFNGGLGNELFQYIFLRRLKLLFDQEAKTDFSYYKGVSNDDDVIGITIWPKRMMKLKG